MDMKITGIPAQRRVGGARRRMPSGRRIKAILALMLIAVSMLLFPLPILTEREEPATVEDDSAMVPAHAVSLLPEDPAVMALALDSAQLELAAEHLTFEIPDAGTAFKTLMDFRSIKDKTSRQWQLQQEAWTDEQGFRRYGDYYMVALGTYYASECGRLFRISFEGGGVIEAVVGDIKSDMDTDALHQHRDGNVVEFIVDTGAISRDCMVMGDMSWADTRFRGKVESIEYLDEI